MNFCQCFYWRLIDLKTNVIIFLLFFVTKFWPHPLCFSIKDFSYYYFGLRPVLEMNVQSVSSKNYSHLNVCVCIKIKAWHPHKNFKHWNIVLFYFNLKKFSFWEIWNDYSGRNLLVIYLALGSSSNFPKSNFGIVRNLNLHNIRIKYLNNSVFYILEIQQSWAHC